MKYTDTYVYISTYISVHDYYNLLEHYNSRIYMRDINSLYYHLVVLPDMLCFEPVICIKLPIILPRTKRISLFRIPF